MYEFTTSLTRRFFDDQFSSLPATHWSFYTNRQGEWGWCQAEHSGYIVKRSVRFFQHRCDCIRDAEQHGY